MSSNKDIGEASNMVGQLAFAGLLATTMPVFGLLIGAIALAGFGQSIAENTKDASRDAKQDKLLDLKIQEQKLRVEQMQIKNQTSLIAMKAQVQEAKNAVQRSGESIGAKAMQFVRENVKSQPAKDQGKGDQAARVSSSQPKASAGTSGERQQPSKPQPVVEAQQQGVAGKSEVKPEQSKSVGNTIVNSVHSTVAHATHKLASVSPKEQGSQQKLQSGQSPGERKQQNDQQAKQKTKDQLPQRAVSDKQKTGYGKNNDEKTSKLKSTKMVQKAALSAQRAAVATQKAKNRGNGQTKVSRVQRDQGRR